MRILNLKLLTADVAAQAHFYTDMLGLPTIERTTQQLALQIGHSLLTFQQDDEPYSPAPTYHFAFNIPADSIEAAAAWLSEIAELLTVSGSPIAEFPNWQARSIYARDPAGNIIECIARREITLPPAGVPFSAADLHGVSEIGLVTPDVPTFAADLQRRYDLPLFHRQPPDPRFTVLGDDEGLFIIVPPERPWYPTTDDRSLIAPLKLSFDGHENGAVQELYLN